MKSEEMQELEKLRERDQKRKERVKRQNDKYNATRDRITFDVPKGRKKDIADFAEKNHTSVNSLVSSVILDIVDGRKTLVDAIQETPKKHTRKSTHKEN